MPNGSSPAAFYSARPTISVGGRDNGDLIGGLLAVSVVENTSGLYHCEALFGNWGTSKGATGFLYFDRQTLDFGSSFAVKFGSHSLFEGHITALEGRFPEGSPPQIGVFAEDRLQDLRMTRRTRTFSNITDREVFTEVASSHGLSPQINLSGPSYKVLAQVNQSDLAFLRERARSIDAEVWVEGDILHAAHRRDRRTSGTTLALSARLREFSVLADLAGQRTAVIANGWDVASKLALTHEATESVISNELSGDESGVGILQAKFGGRKDSLAHGVPLTDAEVQAQAEAVFRHAARRFVVGRGVAETDGSLRVGRDVELQGLGPLFSGKYYLSEVRHRFDGSKGLRTEFIAERPGLGRT